jgi:S1-C subfamily serine protease
MTAAAASTDLQTRLSADDGKGNMSRMVVAGALSIAVALAGSIAADAGALPGEATLKVAPLLKKLAPAVVSIEIRGRVLSESGAKKNETHEIHGFGSGVIYDAGQGLVVTNSHVIEHAEQMTVTLTDGRELAAKRVGADPDFDLAIIKVEAKNLTSMPFADSSELQIGDFVLAIGFPIGMGQTVTSGIVGGLHRNNVGIEQYENFIQTDAAIYPGSSGGALVNLEGDLVGICTAFGGSGNNNPGMGFAIPVNMARTIADQIIEFGEVRRGSIGITTENAKLGAPHDAKLSAPQSGAVITKVESGSPAARAGLKPGDVVVRLGDRTVVSSAFLRNRIALLRVGEAAELAILRGGKPLTIRATVAARNERSRSK